MRASVVLKQNTKTAIYLNTITFSKSKTFIKKTPLIKLHIPLFWFFISLNVTPPGVIVLMLFMLLAVRGFATAARAKSDMAAFTAVGLTAGLSFQAFVIVGGVTRLLPLTGVTLPFMSQGGSSDRKSVV